MFTQLGLGPAVSAALTRLGFETPTPIQTQAIPRVLSGVDLLARAQTGTGKTAAFGLPMIDRLARSLATADRRRPRGLVLVPTRELAVQVHEALESYAATTGLRIAVIYGGVPMPAQTRGLRRGVDIVVATPGRLIDHLERRTVDLSAVEMFTLDEGDRMLDMGFLPALKAIVRVLPPRRQTLLFSATLSGAIAKVAAEFTRNPVKVDVSPALVVATTVTHVVHQVTVDQKRAALAHILAEPGAGQALVFCRTKRGANKVGDDLEARGVRTDVIHGNKSQNARSRALDGFKAGRVRVLVATDVAARGLDIAALPLVVNFDLPLVPEDYVHRVGRTGRAGQPGRAVSLASAADAALLRQIQKVVAAPLERASGPLPLGAPGVSDAPRRQHAPAPVAHDRARFSRPPSRGARGWQGPRPPRRGNDRRHGGSRRPAAV